MSEFTAIRGPDSSATLSPEGAVPPPTLPKQAIKCEKLFIYLAKKISFTVKNVDRKPMARKGVLLVGAAGKVVTAGRARGATLINTTTKSHSSLSAHLPTYLPVPGHCICYLMVSYYRRETSLPPGRSHCPGGGGGGGGSSFPRVDPDISGSWMEAPPTPPPEQQLFIPTTTTATPPAA